MGTTVQKFFHSTTEQDFTAPSEVDIRKLLESAPGTNSTTICTHPNAAGTTQITLDPYTNSSTASDIRANAGWAINRLGTDGMASVALAFRTIPSGVWTFTLSVAIPAAGTLTGTLTVSALITVYRVDSTGNRTALFSATSNTVASAAAAGANSGVLTATSASQPQYILATNETIHVGFLSNMVQVAGAVGATVAGVATYTIGTATEFVQVPSPGVRTQSNTTQSVTTVNTPTRPIIGIGKAPITVTTINTPTITKRLTLTRLFSLITTNTPTLAKRNIFARTFSVVTTNTPRLFVYLDVRNLPVGGGGTTIIRKIFTLLDD